MVIESLKLGDKLLSLLLLLLNKRVVNFLVCLVVFLWLSYVFKLELPSFEHHRDKVVKLVV